MTFFCGHFRQLLVKVTEVSDDPSKRTRELLSSSRIKPRPKVCPVENVFFI